jgi:hypothetical protein
VKLFYAHLHLAIPCWLFALPNSTGVITMRKMSIIFILVGLVLLAEGIIPSNSRNHIQAQEQSTTYTVRQQGNDSNCDYIAVANGIQNIGGDGEHAYHTARALVPQMERDYREGFYTRLGSHGSDLPFSIDNLGAAPEAFVGLYEALGYNAVFLATTPDQVDLAFVQTIRDRLAANPTGSFVHLWITPRPYNPQARIFHVAETGEQVPLLYPYHEVAAMASDNPNALLILDGLVGRPYELTLEQLAYQVRGFNRALVVSRNDGHLEDHQRVQMSQAGQPYIHAPLGGVYLTHARQRWGADYQEWGAVIGQPYQAMHNQALTTQLPGRYVQYVRLDASTMTLAPLGWQMVQELAAFNAIPDDALRPDDNPALQGGIRDWAIARFGSTDNFERAFGQVLTTEFWVSQEHMQYTVLNGIPHPIVGQDDRGGYICVLSEYAMIAWDLEHGVFLLPLGQIYHTQFAQEVGAR